MNRSGPIDFEVWGARGSRSLLPPTSRIANHTSCYSLASGRDLFVFDAGRGLGILSHAVSSLRRFREIERVHVLLSHSHMDHWEGLKDAGWFWHDGNGLTIRILGSDEAIRAVRNGYGHPAYVPLELLAKKTVKTLSFRTLSPGAVKRVHGFRVRSLPLHHYSGARRSKNVLDTLGYQLRTPEGVTIAYLCDHEPTPETEPTEKRLVEGAHLAVIDAHFPDRSQHAFGHGSLEFASEVAGRHPDTTVLASHHGPTFSDAAIRTAFRRHRNGKRNLALAVEGLRLRWDRRTGRFGAAPA